MRKRVFTVVGARPQFIKAATVSLALAREDAAEEVLLHTGQHYDSGMSDVFFHQLGIPTPNYRLSLGGGTHGLMTGRMLEQIESLMLQEKPDCVLVYGDTNSTLAGALAAVKLHIPVAHVEAGLRSYDRNMPEEINRVLTDQVSRTLFCPTEVAVTNLLREGISDGNVVHVALTGDVMEDAACTFRERAIPPPGFSVDPGFVLATVHRAENTDDEKRLLEIITGLEALNKVRPVVFPAHPRTKQAIQKLRRAPEFTLIEPVGYFEMLWLLDHCGLVATDSGGVQKEAFFHGRHCITLRESTEWTELLQAGVNVLVGANAHRIEREGRVRLDAIATNDGSLYGGGNAASRIARVLIDD